MSRLDDYAAFRLATDGMSDSGSSKGCGGCLLAVMAILGVLVWIGCWIF